MTVEELRALLKETAECLDQLAEKYCSDTFDFEKKKDYMRAKVLVEILVGEDL